MNVIEEQHLKEWLSTNPQWALGNNEIVFEKTFDDFVSAFGFLSRLALIMEKHNHHPTIENTYATVKLSMNTHDAGDKITDKDLNLAEEINKLI